MATQGGVSRRYAAASMAVQKRIARATRQTLLGGKSSTIPVKMAPEVIGQGWYDPENANKIQYKSCMVNGQEISRGDFIAFKNPNPRHLAFTAIVLEIYERIGKGKKETINEAAFMEIMWLYRTDELTPSKLRPLDAQENHVYLSDMTDSQPVTGNEIKINVIPAYMATGDEEDDVMICREMLGDDRKLYTLTKSMWEEALARAHDYTVGQLVERKPRHTLTKDKKKRKRQQKVKTVKTVENKEPTDSAKDEPNAEESDESSSDHYTPTIDSSSEDEMDEEEEAEDVDTIGESDLDDDDRRKTVQKRKRGRPRTINKVVKDNKVRVKACRITCTIKRKRVPVIIPDTSVERPLAQGVYEVMRSKLHVSAIPDNLVGREDEYAEIFGFVESKVASCESGSMYISGVPGTGKTATVHEVMRRLQATVEDGDLPPFVFIEINGMRLTEPLQAYSKVWELLTGEQVTPKHGLDLLETYFTTPSPRRECIVLLVDELDQLIVGNKHNVMYEFFNWPMSEHARLIVLTIANTMDLPERMLSQKVASRLGLCRVTFEPYTYTQLVDIIDARLSGLDVFKPEAIQLCTRKVAAASGDARRALDICRYATEIAEAKAKAGEVNAKVGLREVEIVIKRMFTSSWIQAITHCSSYEKLFLAALLLEFRGRGVEEAAFQMVANRHKAICQMHAIESLTVTSLTSICTRLAGIRLLISENPHTGPYQRLRLNLDPSELELALKTDKTIPFFSHLL